MPEFTLKRVLKTLLFIAVLILGPWLLWPPAEEGEAETDSGEALQEPEPDTGVRYRLRVAPGGFYMPGTTPMGIGEPLEAFEVVTRAFEKKFPDTRVELVNVPSFQREWLVTQLSSGKAPDIVMVNVEDVWQDVQKGWYVPLDSFLEAPNPFVPPGEPGSEQWWDMFRYQAISRGKAAPDGKSYCVSLDMVETGIFYNKTIFEDAGLEVPESWEEMLEIGRRLQEYRNKEGESVIPFLTVEGAYADWGVDLILDQLYYEILPGIDLVQDPIREPYMEGYLDWAEIAFLYGKGFFTRQDPRWVEIWRIMKEWREYWNRDLMTVDRMRLFLNQRGAMMWDGSWDVQKLARDPEIDFEWGVFYLPPITRATSPYACEPPVETCVIGGAAMQYEVSNSAVGDVPEFDKTGRRLSIEERMARSERLKRVIQYLHWLCLPENTDRIVNETTAFLPNIVGVPVQPSLQPFAEILERRYTTTKWTFTFDMRFNEIQNRMLGLYLNDGIDQEELLDWMERNLDAAIATIERRKKIDYSEIEAAWERLAPVRAGMRGLPEGVEDRKPLPPG